MPTDKDVAKRIAGRKWAEEVIADLPANERDEYRRAFMSFIKQGFTVTELDPRAMTDNASRVFGRQILRFGVHLGETYDECPLDYLEWLVDRNTELVRYLRSRRIHEERKTDAQN